MAGQKQAVTFDIQEDALRMLKAAADKYSLPNESKALRVILDYVAQEGDWETIFSQSRCLRCGDRGGWTGRGAA